MSTEKLLCAGFGGQGIMSMGMMLAYSAMVEDKHVSWCPSYGPEMRGGTANCSIVISDDEVASPIVTGDANAVIVMNPPSLKKFESYVKKGGLLIINSSLVDEKATRNDIDVKYVDANHIAQEMKSDGKVANMIMLGALLKLKPMVQIDTIKKSFLSVFGKNKEKFLPLNEKAIESGANAV